MSKRELPKSLRDLEEGDEQLAITQKGKEVALAMVLRDAIEMVRHEKNAKLVEEFLMDIDARRRAFPIRELYNPKKHDRNTDAIVRLSIMPYLFIAFAFDGIEVSFDNLFAPDTLRMMKRMLGDMMGEI